MGCAASSPSPSGLQAQMAVGPHHLNFDLEIRTKSVEPPSFGRPNEPKTPVTPVTTVSEPAAGLESVHQPPILHVPAPEEGALLLAAPKPSADVTERGVMLGFLLRLAESDGVDEGWTIQQLVDKYVRPSSAAAKCSLFDLVPAKYSGKPRFFISHTWSRKLGALLQLLRQHFSNSFGVSAITHHVVWLDVVAINQHPYEDQGCLLNEDVAGLARVVSTTEQTLFCMDTECVSLTRIWCLFEVWQTFLAKGVEGLMVLMPEVNVGKLKEVFKTFDVKQAHATQEADRADILSRIEGSSGSTQVNLQLKAALVDSAVHHATHTVATGEAQASLMTRGADMLTANGRYAEAEPMYRQALEAYTRVLGPDHPDTIGAVSNLALCIDGQGRFSEAEPMYRQALESHTRVQGPDHPDTIDSVDHLALCINYQGRYAEAEPMYRQALERHTRVLGADHLSTIISINCLAVCIDDQDRHAEAEPMYRQALETRMRVLGADHPDTVTSINNLATCLDDQDRHAEAEPMYRQALETRMRVLGPDHPSTIASVNNLATCLTDHGRCEEAEIMYSRALEARTRVLGADHPSTIHSVNNLAACMTDQGRHPEAEPMYRQVLAARTRVLGADDADTVHSINYLATCVSAQGRHTEAEALFRQALEVRTRVHGAEHPSTGNSMYNLADLLVAGGRPAEARALFMSAAEVYSQAYGPQHSETLDAVCRAEQL